MSREQVDLWSEPGRATAQVSMVALLKRDAVLAARDEAPTREMDREQLRHLLARCRWAAAESHETPQRPSKKRTPFSSLYVFRLHEK